MAISVISTNAYKTSGVKMLVYGKAGVGKTVLCSTCPKPIILSAEAGLLSLRKFDIPVIEINTVEDLMEAYSYLCGDAGAVYDTICLDSLSEIGEVVLINAKKTCKDPRQAYGELITQMQDAIRAFRDIPRFNVYFSAKMEYAKDELGTFHYVPSMPGAKLSPAIPYYFDEVFHLGVGKDTETGNEFRYLRTKADFQYEAKDRSDSLELFEAPDLGYIINKIKGDL